MLIKLHNPWIVLIEVFVAVASVCNALDFNLTESCADRQTDFCTLENLMSTSYDQLIIKNANQTKLKELIIKQSLFFSLPNEFFSLAPSLESFIMYSCRLNRIYPSDFSRAQNLRKLMLQKNLIAQIPEDAFSHATNLIELRLDYNQIHLVHRQAFAGLSRLKHLTLQRNAISELNGDIFADLVNLEHIDLSHNRIEKLDSQLFKMNSKLKTVVLNDNQFKIFQPNTLMHFPHLRLLDLSNSNIDELQLQSVDTLNVQNNNLKRLSINGSVFSLRGGNNRLASLEIADKLALHEAYLHANLFANLRDFTGMLNLQHLDVSKNLLDSLSTTDSPSYLKLPSLMVLNAAHNNIVELNAEAFILLEKLTHLDLSYNRLYEVRVSTLDPLMSLEKFYLEGNHIRDFDFERLLRDHQNLSEVCLGDNNMNLHIANRMLQFFAAHKILMCHLRATKGSSTHLLQEQQQQQPVHVTGIHPYWTLKDILAFTMLLVVLVILIALAIKVFHEDGCFRNCCRRTRGILRHGQRLSSEDEDDSEV